MNSRELAAKELLAKRLQHLERNGELVVPERLEISNLLDDKHIETLHHLYEKQPEKFIEDLDIVSYISSTHPRYGFAIHILRDLEYRSLPEESKFPISLLVSEETEIYYHGPALCGWVYQQLSHSLGIIVSNHKFASFFQSETFEYSSYDKFIKDNYGNEDACTYCIPNKTDKRDEFYVSDTFPLLDIPNWNVMNNAHQVMDAFNEVKYPYDEIILRRCFSISQQIEEGKSFCLSFGQFAQIFPLLSRMKEKKSSVNIARAKKPKKWDNQIFFGVFVCSSNFSGAQMKKYREYNAKTANGKMSLINLNCKVEYYITIDLRHQLVLIKSFNEHCEGCHNYQKYKGYLIMRKLITAYSIEELEDRFPHEIVKYFGKDEINLKNKHTFFKPRKAKFITRDTEL
ncbi:hypothetical protein C6P40_001963 [Pichia californica]|uniref:Uncharacterized protein n=1 Tax=Pichia californica TaxID=460514 RepID=A0A9P6WIB5_9ASCO|nr:hypothetical protein C6P42_001958 [[Candida] californica]KAG0687714.1 hypothetical protein C6P40_001963 [[Candida] californica]